MKNNISIQKMNICDIDIVKDIEKRQNINILPYSCIKDDLENECYKYFVAKLDNKIVGYIGVKCIFDSADLLSIVTDSNFKRCHIATTMLEYVIDYLLNNNVKELLLEVRKSNIPAISLYEKFHFEKISIRKDYYQNPTEDAIIYRKIIK